MAYGIVNKSGCEERKGNVKVRLDFYLEPTDPRYNDTYIPIIDPDTEKPTGEYQLVPFHSHFVHFAPDITVEDIKAEMDFHLPNFYKAFQNRWDEANGGMRHGWAVGKRIRPLDYSKDALRVAQCQDSVDALAEFSYKPKAKKGQEFPATEIDIGPGATDRTSFHADSTTLIDLANPANDTGTIDTFEVWAQVNMDGTNKVGTFHGSGTSYTNRDGETIGTVTAGAKRTFTGLTIDVTSGDFAGIYFSAGRVERVLAGGVDVYYDAGDQFGTGVQTYTELDADAISIYGTGETAGGTDYPISTSCNLSVAATIDREVALVRTSSSSLSATTTLTPSVLAWLTGWYCRKSIPISGSMGAADPYQMVDVEVYKDDNSKNGNGQVDCVGHIDDAFDGIRFTAADGTTLLNKFPHDLSSGTSCEFDVACSNGATSIYCYFDTGKSAQTYPLKHGMWGHAITNPNTKQQGVRYNGTYDRTYVAYQALDNSVWITAYSHDDFEWLTPKKIGDSPHVDMHATPGFDITPSGTYAGYGHFFFGWHDMASEVNHGKYYRADLDVAWASISFTDKTTALGTVFCSYPQISADTDGRVWFFFRGGSVQADGNYKQSYMYSDDNGDNWSSIYIFIDLSGLGYYVYASGLVVESGSTPIIHVAWNTYTGSNYVDVCYAYRAAGDGAQNWYDISDTNLGTSITGTEGRINTDYAMHCILKLDSSDYPAIIYEEGTALDDVKFIKWNGSSWDSATILSGVAIGGSIGGLEFTTDTQVETYLNELVSGVMEIRHHRGTLNGSWSFSLQASITSSSTDGGIVQNLGNGNPKLVKNATAADVLLVWTYNPEGTPSTVRAYPKDIVSTDFDTVNPTWIYIDRFDRVLLGTEYIANRRYGGWKITELGSGTVLIVSNRLQLYTPGPDESHYAYTITQHQYSFTEGVRFRAEINKTSWGSDVRFFNGIMDVSAGWAESYGIPNTSIHCAYLTTTSVVFQIRTGGTLRVDTTCTVGSGDNEIEILYDFTSGNYEFNVDGVQETSGTLDSAYWAAAQAVDTPFASTYTYVATTQVYEVTFGEYIHTEPTWGSAGALEFSVMATSSSLSLTPSVTRIYGRLISTNSALSLTPTLARVYGRLISTDSNISGSPSLSFISTFHRAISPSVSLEPTISRQLATDKTISSSLSLASSLTRIYGWVRTTLSNLSATVLLTKGPVTYTRVISPALSLTVPMAIRTGLGVAISVALSVATSVSGVIGFVRDTTANLDLTATIAKARGWTETINSNLQLTASISKVIAWVRTTSSEIDAIASIILTGANQFFKSVTTNLSVTATIARQLVITRTSTASLDLTASLSRLAVRTRSITASLALTVALSAWTALERSFISFTAKFRNRVLGFKLHGRSLITKIGFRLHGESTPPGTGVER